MPRKKGWRTPDEIREKIQGSQIINRLSKHVMGDVEMTPSQVNAAKTLLGKVIPDLKAVEHSGNPDNPLNHQHNVVERRIVDPTDRDT
jgi:hypothetical protein